MDMAPPKSWGWVEEAALIWQNIPIGSPCRTHNLCCITPAPEPVLSRKAGTNSMNSYFIFLVLSISSTTSTFTSPGAKQNDFHLLTWLKMVRWKPRLSESYAVRLKKCSKAYTSFHTLMLCLPLPLWQSQTHSLTIWAYFISSLLNKCYLRKGNLWVFLDLPSLEKTDWYQNK